MWDLEGAWRCNIYELHTPAFIFDESQLRRSAEAATDAAIQSGAKLLYSIKPLSADWILTQISNHVRGFATSSLFEAKLSRDLASTEHSVHIYSPAYREEELPLIAAVCDYISFNSFNQWKGFEPFAKGDKQHGLRINPKKSFAPDARYDPCRPQSRLGIALPDLKHRVRSDSKFLKGISGLHFHNNCDSTNFEELRATIEHIDYELGQILSNLSWMNLGGGYLFDEAESLTPFIRAVDVLIQKYGIEVYIEPGAAITRKAGYLVATVLDVFTSDGKLIGILDTTVNHAPEVFEYQFQPDVVGAHANGEFAVLLTGCSCLAGDIFGEYRFDEPIRIGTRIIFANMGAYSMTKWHMFNGINLPSIYSLTDYDGVVLKKQFTYQDFAQRNGVPAHAIV